MSEFELGSRVVCIKDYEKLVSGCHYSIKGSGDLSWNYSTDKKGFGFSVEHESYDHNKKRTNTTLYYFKSSEMYDYFISEEQDYKAHLRDEKIEEILR